MLNYLTISTCFLNSFELAASWKLYQMPVGFFLFFQRDNKNSVAAKPKVCALITELVGRQTQILHPGQLLKKKKSLKVIF